MRGIDLVVWGCPGGGFIMRPSHWQMGRLAPLHGGCDVVALGGRDAAAR